MYRLKSINARLKEEWRGAVEGPSSTSYEGETFRLHVIFPANYQFEPPTVTFKFKVYHCNIHVYSNILSKDRFSSCTVGILF